jgi:hypothetical protein
MDPVEAISLDRQFQRASSLEGHYTSVDREGQVG